MKVCILSHFIQETVQEPVKETPIMHAEEPPIPEPVQEPVKETPIVHAEEAPVIEKPVEKAPPPSMPEPEPEITPDDIFGNVQFSEDEELPPYGLDPFYDETR